MSSPRFLYAPVDADPARTIYVDGTVAGFRSLSHWPGNATPRTLKRDLSTGIALAWAALPDAERVQHLGPFDQFANNHYDTDGVLSAWAVLEPEAALGADDLLLRAAATGDFGTWNGADALALELMIMGLPDHPESPVPPTPGATHDQRRAACYAWCFEHLPQLLADPFSHAGPWKNRLEDIQRDLRRVDEADGVSVERFPDVDLAVVVTHRTLTRLGLNRAAGECRRVLLARTEPAGTRCRFYYRVESWFELVSVDVPERVPLASLMAKLNRRESGPSDSGRWWCTSLEQPVAQMGFSDPTLAGDGFSEDPSLDAFETSSIPLAEIVERLRDTLASAATGSGTKP